MKHKKPPFEITNQIIDYVAEIAELVGRLTDSHLPYPQSHAAPRQPYPNYTWVVGD